MSSFLIGALVLAVVWVAQNELPITFGGQAFSNTDASYTNVLPALNLDADIRSDMKLRASLGTTIGRARYDQLQGGLTLGTIANVFTGGTASVGNPALKPVKSKNLDLSWEWYYDKQSVLSLAYFRKQMDNYAGQTLVSQSLYDLHTRSAAPTTRRRCPPAAALRPTPTASATTSWATSTASPASRRPA